MSTLETKGEPQVFNPTNRGELFSEENVRLISDLLGTACQTLFAKGGYSYILEKRGLFVACLFNFYESRKAPTHSELFINSRMGKPGLSVEMDRVNRLSIDVKECLVRFIDEDHKRDTYKEIALDAFGNCRIVLL